MPTSVSRLANINKAVNKEIKKFQELNLEMSRKK
jgi:hypothetical protein